MLYNGAKTSGTVAPNTNVDMGIKFPKAFMMNIKDSQFSSLLYCEDGNTVKYLSEGYPHIVKLSNGNMGWYHTYGSTYTWNWTYNLFGME